MSDVDKMWCATWTKCGVRHEQNVVCDVDIVNSNNTTFAKHVSHCTFLCHG